jgi:hypothetical protein
VKIGLILCAFDRHDFGPDWTDEDGRIYRDCLRCCERRQVLTEEYMRKLFRSLNRR